MSLEKRIIDGDFQEPIVPEEIKKAERRQRKNKGGKKTRRSKPAMIEEMPSSSGSDVNATPLYPVNESEPTPLTPDGTDKTIVPPPASYQESNSGSEANDDKSSRGWSSSGWFLMSGFIRKLTLGSEKPEENLPIKTTSDKSSSYTSEYSSSDDQQEMPQAMEVNFDFSSYERGEDFLKKLAQYFQEQFEQQIGSITELSEHMSELGNNVLNFITMYAFGPEVYGHFFDSLKKTNLEEEALLVEDQDSVYELNPALVEKLDPESEEGRIVLFLKNFMEAINGVSVPNQVSEEYFFTDIPNRFKQSYLLIIQGYFGKRLDKINLHEAEADYKQAEALYGKIHSLLAMLNDPEMHYSGSFYTVMQKIKVLEGPRTELELFKHYETDDTLGWLPLNTKAKDSSLFQTITGTDTVTAFDHLLNLLNDLTHMLNWKFTEKTAESLKPQLENWHKYYLKKISACLNESQAFFELVLQDSQSEIVKEAIQNALADSLGRDEENIFQQYVHFLKNGSAPYKAIRKQISTYLEKKGEEFKDSVLEGISNDLLVEGCSAEDFVSSELDMIAEYCDIAVQGLKEQEAKLNKLIAEVLEERLLQEIEAFEDRIVGSDLSSLLLTMNSMLEALELIETSAQNSYEERKQDINEKMERLKGLVEEEEELNDVLQQLAVLEKAVDGLSSSRSEEISEEEQPLPSELYLQIKEIKKSLETLSIAELFSEKLKAGIKEVEDCLTRLSHFLKNQFENEWYNNVKKTFALSGFSKEDVGELKIFVAGITGGLENFVLAELTYNPSSEELESLANKVSNINSDGYGQINVTFNSIEKTFLKEFLLASKVDNLANNITSERSPLLEFPRDLEDGLPEHVLIQRFETIQVLLKEIKSFSLQVANFDQETADFYKDLEMTRVELANFLSETQTRLSDLSESKLAQLEEDAEGFSLNKSLDDILGLQEDLDTLFSDQNFVGCIEFNDRRNQLGTLLNNQSKCLQKKVALERLEEQASLLFDNPFFEISDALEAYQAVLGEFEDLISNLRNLLEEDELQGLDAFIQKHRSLADLVQNQAGFNNLRDILEKQLLSLSSKKKLDLDLDIFNLDNLGELLGGFSDLSEKFSSHQQNQAISFDGASHLALIDFCLLLIGGVEHAVKRSELQSAYKFKRAFIYFLKGDVSSGYNSLGHAIAVAIEDYLKKEASTEELRYVEAYLERYLAAAQLGGASKDLFKSFQKKKEEVKYRIHLADAEVLSQGEVNLDNIEQFISTHQGLPDSEYDLKLALVEKLFNFARNDDRYQNLPLENLIDLHSVFEQHLELDGLHELNQEMAWSVYGLYLEQKTDGIDLKSFLGSKGPLYSFVKTILEGEGAAFQGIKEIEDYLKESVDLDDLIGSIEAVLTKIHKINDIFRRFGENFGHALQAKKLKKMIDSALLKNFSKAIDLLSEKVPVEELSGILTDSFASYASQSFFICKLAVDYFFNDCISDVVGELGNSVGCWNSKLEGLQKAYQVFIFLQRAVFDIEDQDFADSRILEYVDQNELASDFMISEENERSASPRGDEQFVRKIGDDHSGLEVLKRALESRSAYLFNNGGLTQSDVRMIAQDHLLGKINDLNEKVMYSYENLSVEDTQHLDVYLTHLNQIKPKIEIIKSFPEELRGYIYCKWPLYESYSLGAVEASENFIESIIEKNLELQEIQACKAWINSVISNLQAYKPEGFRNQIHNNAGKRDKVVQDLENIRDEVVNFGSGAIGVLRQVVDVLQTSYDGLGKRAKEGKYAQKLLESVELFKAVFVDLWYGTDMTFFDLLKSDDLVFQQACWLETKRTTDVDNQINCTYKVYSEQPTTLEYQESYNEKRDFVERNDGADSITFFVDLSHMNDDGVTTTYSNIPESGLDILLRIAVERIMLDAPQDQIEEDRALTIEQVIENTIS